MDEENPVTNVFIYTLLSIEFNKPSLKCERCEPMQLLRQRIHKKNELMIIAATREEQKNGHISSAISWKINVRTFNVSFQQKKIKIQCDLQKMH